MRKTNYHTHIYLCKHATGTPFDYLKKAEELHYDALGISDHGPFPSELARKLKSRRMSYDEYCEIYLPLLNDLQSQKMTNISLYKAVEIEYLSELKNINAYDNFLQDLDYLVLGQHFYEYNGEIISIYAPINKEKLVEYANQVVEALSTKKFKILAHPDIFCWCYDTFDELATEVSKKIIETAIKNDVYLEINANGIRNSAIFKKTKQENNINIYPYPNYYFWKIVSNYPDAKVIINDDSHSVDNFNDHATEEAISFAEMLNINVISTDIFKK